LKPWTLLVELLNRGVSPVVPEKGSVGASGDLAPLAHLALVLIGLGEAFYEGERLSGFEALSRCGLEAAGTGSRRGRGPGERHAGHDRHRRLATHDGLRLSKIADIGRGHEPGGPHGKQNRVSSKNSRAATPSRTGAAADNMERLTRNSEIISSHKDCSRVQDAYTLRCSPQVHGASKDAMAYVIRVIETEMNSSTGNPLVFPETRDFLLGGNFHGQPVALALDFLCHGCRRDRRHLGAKDRKAGQSLPERSARLSRQRGRTEFRVHDRPVHRSIPGFGKQDPFPSCMRGFHSHFGEQGRSCLHGHDRSQQSREVVRNAEHVLAIELLCAAQALDLFTNMKPGEGTLAGYRVIREAVPHLDKDRVLSPDIESVVGLIRNGLLLDAVEKTVGPTNRLGRGPHSTNQMRSRWSTAIAYGLAEVPPGVGHSLIMPVAGSSLPRNPWA
jgi:histidine ammonia-lyase